LGSRTKGIALVLCLIVLAGGIALVSQTLVPPVFGIRIESLVVPNSGTGPSPGHNSTFGTLAVVVTSSMNLAGGLFTTPYVSGVGVSVVPTRVAPLYPVVYATNSTGQLQVSLTPSNYSVTFFSLPMNVTVPVQVHERMTTMLQLAITGDDYKASFLSLPANQSDFVAAWSHGTLEVGSSVALLGASAAFLDLSYVPNAGSNGSSTQARQVPVLVAASDVRPSSSTAEQWVSFQPESGLSLEGLSQVGLSVYGAYANVTVYDTPGYGGS
jgi:hypothetical protein